MGIGANLSNSMAEFMVFCSVAGMILVDAFKVQAIEYPANAIFAVYVREDSSQIDRLPWVWVMSVAFPFVILFRLLSTNAIFSLLIIHREVVSPERGRETDNGEDQES